MIQYSSEDRDLISVVQSLRDFKHVTKYFPLFRNGILSNYYFLNVETVSGIFLLVIFICLLYNCMCLLLRRRDQFSEPP